MRANKKPRIRWNARFMVLPDMVTQKKWLGRQDSNLGSRDQNPMPYRLATPQRAGPNHSTDHSGFQLDAEGVSRISAATPSTPQAPTHHDGRAAARATDSAFAASLLANKANNVTPQPAFRVENSRTSSASFF